MQRMQQASISDFFGKKNEPATERKKRKLEKLENTENSVNSLSRNPPSSPKSSVASTVALTTSATKELLFCSLCDVFKEIESTTKRHRLLLLFNVRLIILDYLVKFFTQVMAEHPQDLLSCVYLSINKLAPTWEGIELGLGESLLIKAIAETTGRSIQKIKEDLAEKGDLGLVAQVSRKSQATMFKPKPLTVKSVFKVLREIALVSGKDSQTFKVNKVKSLLVACQGSEAKYLIRALEGKLRIGLAEMTVLAALGQSGVLHHHRDATSEDLQKGAEIMKRVFNEMPTYDIIVPEILNHGISYLDSHCKLTPGIPLKPMLAHPTKSISEVLNRFENIPFTCEYKYDGERAQIHLLENGEVKIFSRNQENMSTKYPDIIDTVEKIKASALKQSLRLNSFVLDSEAVAWDVQKSEILPFQVLSTRKRKDVEKSDIKVKVCLFAFDLLYLNGETLIRHSLSERRKMLREHFPIIESEFCMAIYKDLKTIDDIQGFLDESVSGHCEGLMVKTLEQDSSYEPSKRSRNWLKLKKDYINGVGDSLDLVVIGGYTGKGKRTGGYGGFLLACYDPENEEYQAICKLGTGFSDEDLVQHAKYFKEHEISSPKSYYSYGEGVKPDIWFEPVQVWEIKAADLSISPVYKAAIGHVDTSKGVSLRFPRFIRVREEKKPENATTAHQVANLYRNQKINTNNADDEEDY